MFYIILSKIKFVVCIDYEVYSSFNKNELFNNSYFRVYYLLHFGLVKLMIITLFLPMK